MSEYYEEIPLEYPKKSRVSTENEFVGDEWSIRKVDSRYIFEYISGELAGMAKSIEVTQSDFELAAAGQISCDELCIKYNVS